MSDKPEVNEPVAPEDPVAEMRRLVDEQKRLLEEAVAENRRLAESMRESSMLIDQLKTENLRLKSERETGTELFLSGLRKGSQEVASESDAKATKDDSPLKGPPSVRLSQLAEPSIQSAKKHSGTSSLNGDSVSSSRKRGPPAEVEHPDDFPLNDSKVASSASRPKSMFASKMFAKTPHSSKSSVIDQKDMVFQSKAGPRTDFSGLIENFFVIGFRLGEEFKPKESPQLQVLHFLFLSDRLEEDHKEQLLKFLDPFPGPMKMTRFKNSIPKLIELMFQDDPAAQAVDFFPIALAPADANRPRPGRPAHMLPFITNNHIDYEVLRESNPDGFQFYYFHRIFDYFISKDPVDPSFFNVYSVPKYFVIRTLYPFSKFFQDFFLNSIGHIRRRRSDRFMESLIEGAIDFSSSSLVQTADRLDQELDLIAKDVQQLQEVKVASNFEQKITLNISNGTRLEWNLPSIKTAPFAEAEFGFAKAFSLFPFEDFLFVFFSILQERSVIFVSEQQHNISACLSAFLVLLRPFKWAFPVIYSLPEDCVVMLSTPMPLLAGLNTSVAKVKNEIIPEIEERLNTGSSNNVYVFLDHGLYYYDFEGMDSLLLPAYDDFLEKASKIFRKAFGSKSSSFFKLAQSKKGSSVYNTLRKTNTTKLKEKLVRMETALEPKFLDLIKIGPAAPVVPDAQIFYFFRYFFNAFVISKLPCDRNLSHFGRETKIKEIDVAFFSTNQSDVEFLEGLMKTQIFMYYLENDFFGISNSV